MSDQGKSRQPIYMECRARWAFGKGSNGKLRLLRSETKAETDHDSTEQNEHTVWQGQKNSRILARSKQKERASLNETENRNLQRRLVLLDICRNGDRIYPVPLGGLDSMGGDGMKTDKRKTAQAAGTAKRGKVKRPTKNIPQKGSVCKYDSME